MLFIATSEERIRGGASPVGMIGLDTGVDEQKRVFDAEGGGEGWPNEVAGPRENRQDGRQMNAQQTTNTAYISRRNLLSTNDECTVIHLSYVAPSALGLL
ncbi:hypothetical protein RB195_023075 [Necator americanus]|uniref:Uncharacterized protein n=1 Tax=Necator americanus TaxID=51031 RepID=A0ABR1EKC0_NECAM